MSVFRLSIFLVLGVFWGSLGFTQGVCEIKERDSSGKGKLTVTDNQPGSGEVLAIVTSRVFDQREIRDVQQLAEDFSARATERDFNDLLTLYDETDDPRIQKQLALLLEGVPKNIVHRFLRWAYRDPRMVRGGDFLLFFQTVKSMLQSGEKQNVEEVMDFITTHRIIEAEDLLLVEFCTGGGQELSLPIVGLTCPRSVNPANFLLALGILYSENEPLGRWWMDLCEEVLQAEPTCEATIYIRYWLDQIRRKRSGEPSSGDESVVTGINQEEWSNKFRDKLFEWNNVMTSAERIQLQNEAVARESIKEDVHDAKNQYYIDRLAREGVFKEKGEEVQFQDIKKYLNNLLRHSFTGAREVQSVDDLAVMGGRQILSLGKYSEGGSEETETGVIWGRKIPAQNSPHN